MTSAVADTGNNREAPLHPRGASWPTRMKRVLDSCDIFDAMTASEGKGMGSTERPSVWDLLGKAMWVALVIVVLSGIGLLAVYVPIPGECFRSAERIQTSSFGWWLRGLHKYGTDLFILLAILRLVRIAWRRSYRFPGELTWVMSLAILLAAMIAGLTGYLLIWNSRGFWTGGILTGETASFDTEYPYGGLGLSGDIAGWIIGGDEATMSALSGILAVHVALGLALMVLGVVWMLRGRRQVLRRAHFDPGIPARLTLWILFALSALALVFPPPLGSPVDKLLKPAPILADWFFLGFYSLASTFNIAIAFWISAMIGLVVILLPWLDRSRARGPRPFVSAMIAGTLVACIVLTFARIIQPSGSASAMIISGILWLVLAVLGIAREIKPAAKSKALPCDEEGTE